MKLIKHHTANGVRTALLVKEGRKYNHLLYICSPRLTRVPKSEERFFTDLGEATQKQRDQFQRSARRFGYDKKVRLV